MTGTLHTYGIFVLKLLAFTGKQDKELGWVYDFKWAFSNYARAERKFEVEHMRLLQSAAKAGGIKIECTPMLEGTPLEPAIIPATLRGNITIIDGEVVITTRVFRHDLEERGIGVEMILSASNCLECTADEQQTLEEAAIQTELKANAEEDAGMDLPFPPGDDEQGTGAQA